MVASGVPSCILLHGFGLGPVPYRISCKFVPVCGRMIVFGFDRVGVGGWALVLLVGPAATLETLGFGLFLLVDVVDLDAVVAVAEPGMETLGDHAVWPEEIAFSFDLGAVDVEVVDGELDDLGVLGHFVGCLVRCFGKILVVKFFEPIPLFIAFGGVF